MSGLFFLFLPINVLNHLTYTNSCEDCRINFIIEKKLIKLSSKSKLWVFFLVACREAHQIELIIREMYIISRWLSINFACLLSRCARKWEARFGEKINNSSHFQLQLLGNRRAIQSWFKSLKFKNISAPVIVIARPAIKAISVFVSGFVDSVHLVLYKAQLIFESNSVCPRTVRQSRYFLFFAKNF